MTAVFSRDFDRETEREARIHGGRLTEADLEEIRQAAFAEGHRQGRIEAETRMREAAETRRAEALRRIRDGVDALLAGREAHERALEAHLLDYAISVGEKVLPELVSARAHQHVMSQIRRGLRMGLGSGRVRVRLNAEDRDLLGPDLDRLIRELGREGRVELLSDEGVRRGDVSVEWDRGGLAFSLTAVCEEILALLRNARSSADSERTGNTVTTRRPA